MSTRLAAMVLAGGKGTRLQSLTKKVAKPAVSYGGKYRIIDFPLSNCANSGITSVGVLTQYESSELNTYIGNGEKWGLNGVRSLTSVLTPKETEEGSNWYLGTADAIYQNIDWLDRVDPEYVLILSGDHIYSCSYDPMLRKHVASGSDCTISCYRVPIQEASRFGILVANDKDEIVEFQEKPKKPISNLASMGIYIFTYKVLRAALIADHKKENSSHDFGKDIIPTMLKEKRKLSVYLYDGYWKDVGTVASLHQANMDLLMSAGTTNLYTVQGDNRIYSEDAHSTPQYIGPSAEVSDSLINQGAQIFGKVRHSVVSGDVVVEESSMPSSGPSPSSTTTKKSTKSATGSPSS